MKPTTRLWTVQAVLAALFLFAGGMKLILPADALAAQSHLPGAFMKFIGICETLGAIGKHCPERYANLSCRWLGRGHHCNARPFRHEADTRQLSFDVDLGTIEIAGHELLTTEPAVDLGTAVNLNEGTQTATPVSA